MTSLTISHHEEEKAVTSLTISHHEEEKVVTSLTISHHAAKCLLPQALATSTLLCSSKTNKQLSFGTHFFLPLKASESHETESKTGLLF